MPQHGGALPAGQFAAFGCVSAGTVAGLSGLSVVRRLLEKTENKVGYATCNHKWSLGCIEGINRMLGVSHLILSTDILTSLSDTSILTRLQGLTSGLASDPIRLLTRFTNGQG